MRVRQDNVGANRTICHVMTLKLGDDVLDQKRGARGLRQHLEAAKRQSPLAGNGGREHDPPEPAGLDDLRQFRRPVPAQETVDFLERNIRA